MVRDVLLFSGGESFFLPFPFPPFLSVCSLRLKRGQIFSDFFKHGFLKPFFLIGWGTPKAGESFSFSLLKNFLFGFRFFFSIPASLF